MLVSLARLPSRRVFSQDDSAREDFFAGFFVSGKTQFSVTAQSFFRTRKGALPWNGQQRVLGLVENPRHRLPFLARDQTVLVRVDVKKMLFRGAGGCLVAGEFAVVIFMATFQHRRKRRHFAEARAVGCNLQLATAEEPFQFSEQVVPNMSINTLAKTPEPPYYAVIFTSLRTEGDRGYGRMAERMIELAAQQPGFLGVETARGADGLDRKSTRLNSSHIQKSRMPSSA